VAIISDPGFLARANEKFHRQDMSKRSLADWAAIAEIAGTGAILVSLIFVVMSIQQNTAQLRLQNENFLYELQDAAQADFVASSELIDISIKLDNAEALTPSEFRRYAAHLARSINVWEMIYYWNRSGHIEEQSWQDWDEFYAAGAESQVFKQLWPALRSTYAPDFVEHVDRKLK
jgi:hypothetical protein